MAGLGGDRIVHSISDMFGASSTGVAAVPGDCFRLCGLWCCDLDIDWDWHEEAEVLVKRPT
jgi:hypothetical protein